MFAKEKRKLREIFEERNIRMTISNDHRNITFHTIPYKFLFDSYFFHGIRKITKMEAKRNLLKTPERFYIKHVLSHWIETAQKGEVGGIILSNRVFPTNGYKEHHDCFQSLGFKQAKDFFSPSDLSLYKMYLSPLLGEYDHVYESYRGYFQNLFTLFQAMEKTFHVIRKEYPSFVSQFDRDIQWYGEGITKKITLKYEKNTFMLFSDTKLFPVSCPVSTPETVSEMLHEALITELKTARIDTIFNAPTHHFEHATKTIPVINATIKDAVYQKLASHCTPLEIEEKIASLHYNEKGYHVPHLVKSYQKNTYLLFELLEWIFLLKIEKCIRTYESFVLLSFPTAQTADAHEALRRMIQSDIENDLSKSLHLA